MASNIIQNIGFYAGNQLKKKDLGPKGMVEYRRFLLMGRRCVTDHTPVIDKGGDGIVDAGKGSIAFGFHFGPAPQNGLPGENEKHTRYTRLTGKAETVQQIFPGVGDGVGQGPLGAGEDNGLAGILDEVGEGGGGVGHGICAMGNDKAVILLKIGLDSFHHKQPMLRLDVGGVNIQQLHSVYLTEPGRLRHTFQQLP